MLIYIHIHRYMYMYVCMYTYIYIYIYTCMILYIYIYICICIYTRSIIAYHAVVVLLTISYSIVYKCFVASWSSSREPSGSSTWNSTRSGSSRKLLYTYIYIYIYMYIYIYRERERYTCSIHMYV